MKPTATTVILRDLATGYRNTHRTVTVGKDINASLHAGRLTCLLGPNGAGKSTLLRTLAGFQPPLAGEVELCGRPLADYTPRQLSKKVSVVLTDRVALANMTVEELVALGRSPYTGFWGHLSAADKSVVNDAIAMMGIEHLRSRLNFTLSDGERQKMMIAKAIAQQTPVVFLDEPTAFLDYPSKVEIMLLLRRLACEKGLTVFLSTHDLDLALQTADELWLVTKVQPLVSGAPEDLSLDGSLARCFDRCGVSFDVHTGLFNIDVAMTRRVRLRGDGPRAAMVAKALRRNAIEALDGDADESLPLIEVTPGAFMLDGTPVGSIAALLGALSEGIADGKMKGK